MTQQSFKSDGAKLTLYLDPPHWEDRPTAAIGAFTCKTEQAGTALLKDAIETAQSQGKERIIGPMDGDTWHSYRCVTYTDDSPAFLLEPATCTMTVSAFESVGFQSIGQYFSARVPLAQAGQYTPNPTKDFTLEAWDGNDPTGLFEQVFDLSTQAFSNNAFYKPITLDAFLAMYLPIVPLIKKELVFFARRPDGQLVGFLFGIPNYAEGPNPTSVILKTYASLHKGVGRHLAHAFHTAAFEMGYETAIHALIHSDNLSAMRSSAEGAQVFREYTLFGRRLDDQPSG